MGRTSIIMYAVLGAGASIVRLIGSLVVIYLTLGWKVRKAREALEKELMRAGMSKADARRIGAQYAALKDNTIKALKQSIGGFRF